MCTSNMDFQLILKFPVLNELSNTCKVFFFFCQEILNGQKSIWINRFKYTVTVCTFHIKLCFSYNFTAVDLQNKLCHQRLVYNFILIFLFLPPLPESIVLIMFLCFLFQFYIMFTTYFASLKHIYVCYYLFNGIIYLLQCSIDSISYKWDRTTCICTMYLFSYSLSFPLFATLSWYSNSLTCLPKVLTSTL